MFSRLPLYLEKHGKTLNSTISAKKELEKIVI